MSPLQSRLHRHAALLLSLLVLCLGTSCSSQPENGTTDESSEQLLRVTATTGMIADAARVIGGDRVMVEGLMGPGVDPHLYKASQRDLVKLSSADIIFYNGLHLEGRMAEVLEKLGGEHHAVAVAEVLPAERLRKAGPGDDTLDPHVWFDAGLWKLVVEGMARELIAAAPEHEPYFSERAAAYLADLEALDAYARERLATIPSTQRVLITAHDAFGYFGAAYDVEVAGLQGISTAAEYGLRDVEELVDFIVARNIKAVFIETSLSPRSIEALVAGVRGRGHEVRIGGELFTDALGAADTPEGAYLGMFRHNVDTIVEALQ